MIIACLIAKGNGYWWNMAINQEAETLEETHETINGRKYYNLSARWEQYKSFSNFFDFLYRSSQNKDDRKTYKKYNESHNMWFISVIRSSIDMEIPDQLPNFDNALKLNFFTDMNKLKKIFCSFCLGYKFIFNRIKFKNDRMKL